MPQPPTVVDPPAPLAAPDGLFVALSRYGGFSETLDVHWQNNGAVWVPDTAVGAETSATPCQTPPYAGFVLDGIDGLAQAWPFVAYASLVTGEFGFSNAEAQRRVRQRLINYEQNVAERALWGGAATLFTGVQNYAGTTQPAAGIAGVAGGIFQQLAAAGASAGYQGELSGGVGVGVVEAVSLLEQSMADHYYGQGFIHARPRMAAYLALRNQFKFIPAPPVEQTWNEDVLILGNGYAGNGPAGEAPTNSTADDLGYEYVWATGRVCVWRAPEIWVSPPEQLLNRNTNQRGLYAIRPYVIGVEAFSACVKVIRAKTTVTA